MAKILKFWHQWSWAVSACGFFVILGTLGTGLYIGACFIETANASAAAVIRLEEFRQNTEIILAMQKEDNQNIKEQLSRMENVQGKIFERINQIADKR